MIGAMAAGLHYDASAQHHPLASAFSLLVNRPRPDGKGQVIGLLSPFSGAGTSYISRSLSGLSAAYFGGQGCRSALVDFDLHKPSQLPHYTGLYGALPGPYDATLGTTPFWQVGPAPKGVTMASAHMNPPPAGQYGHLFLTPDQRLAIISFNWSNVAAGQEVHVDEARQYWYALREVFPLTLVDCPAFDRSDVALTIMAEMDSWVMIAPNAQSDTAPAQALAQTIVQRGGRCAGMIVNEHKHNVLAQPLPLAM